jgi:hypothetical protein
MRRQKVSFDMGGRMKIAPTDKDFVFYRCLHAGLLSPSNIEQKSTDVPGLPKEQIDRNRLFLRRLIDTYGSCAGTIPSLEFKNYLMQLLQGKYGAVRQKELGEICAGKSLAEIAVYHTVECQLDS